MTTDTTESSRKPGCCHQCGLPLADNPHPEAGKPAHYLEVGVQKECVPCLVLSRHQWAGRAMKAESRVAKLEGQLSAQTAVKTEQPPQNCREAGPGNGLCDHCAAGRYERCRYTHPPVIQTEQPSLSDHQLNYVQECIERAKLLPVWDNVPHSLHAELDNIFRGVALLSAQRQDHINDVVNMVPQRQDSDKDAG